jgi:hypothetical protein
MQDGLVCEGTKQYFRNLYKINSVWYLHSEPHQRQVGSLVMLCNREFCGVMCAVPVTLLGQCKFVKVDKLNVVWVTETRNSCRSLVEKIFENGYMQDRKGDRRILLK